MRFSFDSTGRRDRLVLVLAFALLALASPLVDWWAQPGSPWYLPFLLWGLVIALVWLLQRGSPRP